MHEVRGLTTEQLILKWKKRQFEMLMLMKIFPTL